MITRIHLSSYAHSSMNRTEKVALARRTAAEGLVLLKNEGNVLPLRPQQEVVLMGVTGYCCHRMGWGSGDMLAQPTVQYDRALADAGIRIDQEVADFYRRQMLDKADAFRTINRNWWKWSVRFPEPFKKDAEFAQFVAGKRAKTCLVVIGRNNGESTDLQDGPGSFRLHWEEDFLLKLACANFDNVVVLLNVCGVIDTEFLDKFPVKAVLLTSLLGETSGSAVADVLTGAVNPSGKLATTWAKRYRDYPTTDCFNSLEVPYHEGIYVGYRYFDTFGVEPRFPFGFGLSYTTFSVKASSPVAKGLKVSVRATVKNTGSVAGRETVQCYLSAPDGKLEKPYQDLCAFAKTPVLEPGATADVSLDFDMADLASYCGKTESYVLEAGDYAVRVGTSSRSTHVAGLLRLDRTVVTLRTKNHFGYDLTGVRLLSKQGAKPYTYRGEAKELASAPVVKLDVSKFRTATAPADPKPALLRAKSGKKKTWTLADAAKGACTVENVVAQFSDAELASCVNGVLFDDFRPEGQTTGVGGFDGKVRGEASEFWHSDKYGIPVNNCADGPSGVRLSIFNEDPAKDSEMAGTMVAFPCGTCVAQGWDEGAAEAFGRAVSNDMALADIDGWLAPGLNIHRNPLCGRNFEYFSEDPLVSGRMAAAIVRGVQRKADGTPSGRYATVKHFAVNNQEFERGVENNVVSERALREIYLRAFRYAVTLGKPLALMTSYNRFNGDWCATTKPLLTSVLRGEWGFDGMVMTDWWNAADPCRHCSSGNDLQMPGNPEKRAKLLAGLQSGKVNRAEVQASAVRILELVLRTTFNR